MKIFYHNDLDGRCSAAIARKYISENQPYSNIKSVEFIEIAYSDEFPIDEIGDKELVWILDFHVEDEEVFNNLIDKARLNCWIDHHKSTINESEKHPEWEKIFGIREDGRAACELVWEYLFFEQEIPLAVEWIGKYDTWRWVDDERATDILSLKTGLNVCNLNVKGPFWDNLFSYSEKDLDDIIRKGEICIKFRDNFCEDYAESYGWETEFEGYDCFAIGIYAFGSHAFGERMDEYDICLSYEFLGDKWIVGLYSEGVDVSEIAMKYGGGGHAGAAGFVIAELPFGKGGEK